MWLSLFFNQEKEYLKKNVQVIFVDTPMYIKRPNTAAIRLNIF